jgi:hypothetical protein
MKHDRPPLAKCKRDRATTRQRAEKDTYAACLETLRALGWHVSRFQQARASKQTAGVPDLYAMHPRLRRALWIELKAPDGRRSPAQAAWHQIAEESGVLVVTVHSAGDLANLLTAIADASEP